MIMNISAKQLKQVADIIVEPLLEIWIKEIIEGMKFPYKLKHAHLSPIFKKFSPFLCGYRKGYNAQYALLAMVEKWKKSR